MPGLDAGTIAAILSKVSPQSGTAQMIQQMAQGGNGGGDRFGPLNPPSHAGGMRGNLPAPFNPNDQGFTGIPPDGGSDAGFLIPKENIGAIGPRTPIQWGQSVPARGSVGAGYGGGAGGGADNSAMMGALAQAIMRRIGNTTIANPGPTSRVDPFNPYGTGSHWREDTSMPSQAGPDIPSAMGQEQIIQGMGRQTSNSPVPPQAMQDYVRSAVLRQLGKLPLGMGR